MAKAPNTDPFASAPASPEAKDPFTDPSAGGGSRPKMADMYGRLLLISPEKIDQQPSLNDASKMVDRLTATVVIVDPGQVAFGGNPQEIPPIPHTMFEDAPYKVDSMFISAVGVVNQCRDALRARELKTGGSTMVLGRLKKGEQKDSTKKAPWRLEPASEEDKELARAYLNSQNPFAS